MSYSWIRSITINHADMVDSDQTNFPVAIIGTYGFLKLVTAPVGGTGAGKLRTGFDFAFSLDQFGTQLLPYEVVQHDTTLGTVEIWIQVPTVSLTADTVFYILYGDPSVTTDQSNRTAVWDSDYIGIYHFGTGAEASLVTTDSTGYARAMTNNNCPPAAGFFKTGAASFLGQANQGDPTVRTWLDVGSMSITPGSIECYGRMTSFFAGNTIFSNISGGQGIQWWDASPLTVNGTNYTLSHPTIWTVSTMCAAWDATSTLAVQGSENSTTVVQTVAAATPAPSAANLLIGREPAVNNNFYAQNWLLDEVRLSRRKRSFGWMASAHNNLVCRDGNSQGDPHFYDIGPENVYTERSRPWICVITD